MDELNQKQLVTATDVLKKNVFFAACNYLESLREFFAQTSCRINTAASVKTNELQFRIRRCLCKTQCTENSLWQHGNAYNLNNTSSALLITRNLTQIRNLFTLKVELIMAANISDTLFFAEFLTNDVYSGRGYIIRTQLSHRTFYCS